MTDQAPSLLESAIAVIAAWHDYIADNGQAAPAMLIDTPAIDNLCAAVSRETGETVTRYPAGYDIDEEIGQPKPVEVADAS